MNRTIVSFAAAILAVFSLGGCGRKSDTAQSAAYQAAQLDESGNIVIQKADITSDATFLNYDGGGVTIQLLAVRAGDGTVRLAYNTCQSCNPSPRAYFVKQGDKFVCQNCGNQYSAEEVGLAAFGCNPTTVDGVTETTDTITINKADLDSNATKFTNWKGPTA